MSVQTRHTGNAYSGDREQQQQMRKLEIRNDDKAKRFAGRAVAEMTRLCQRP